MENYLLIKIMKNEVVSLKYIDCIHRHRLQPMTEYQICSRSSEFVYNFACQTTFKICSFWINSLSFQHIIV